MFSLGRLMVKNGYSVPHIGSLVNIAIDVTGLDVKKVEMAFL